MPLQRRWHDEKNKNFACSAGRRWRGSLHPNASQVFGQRKVREYIGLLTGFP